ncbi:hypothetical protein CR513_02854, partial [Mucuna pruriens]
MSLINCLASKIIPIVERLTGHKFDIKTNTCHVEISIDKEKLLQVAGVAVAAIAAVIGLLCICKVTCRCCKVIFRCCRGRGKTMKAPGRDYRIYRNDFERDPANYFRTNRQGGSTTKVIPIVERLTGHKFSIKTNTCVEEITMDREKLAAIAVIFGCCGKRGKTMKAPGRNYRISRKDFERNPANYFRNLQITV